MVLTLKNHQQLYIVSSFHIVTVVYFSSLTLSAQCMYKKEYVSHFQHACVNIFLDHLPTPTHVSARPKSQEHAIYNMGMIR